MRIMGVNFGISRDTNFRLSEGLMEIRNTPQLYRVGQARMGP